jgi:ferredoxin
MMHVDKPGFFSLLQECGRYGVQRLGVPVNGAMDEWSHRVANLLVGNGKTAATLECTLQGPHLRFDHDTLIAITGADMEIAIDGVQAPRNRAVLVRRNTTLAFGKRTGGARAYLAVRGGFATEPVLGSRSTFVRGAFGGFEGRALRKGDQVPLHPTDARQLRNCRPTQPACRRRSPRGTFIVPPASRQPIVLFAGGIGITPFVAYLESVKHLEEIPETWLFYANRNGATHAYRKRILELKKTLPSLKVVNCYSDPLEEVLGRDYEMRGRTTAEVVSDDLICRRARFYLCGAEPMMVSITVGLIGRGVPAFDIFKEVFRSPVSPRLDPSQRFIVEFARSHEKAEWSPDKGSLLAFAEGLGINMPSGCRVGQCESCIVRISAGKVEHTSGHAPEEADMCFACQAIPASKITIEA